MNSTASKSSVRSQVSRNAVALISLVIAITSLSYNTWRNEHTEANRNIRVAGFELLSKLSELKELVYLGHYDHDMQRGNPRIGWTYVVTIGDLSELLPEPLPQKTRQLNDVWSDNWEGVGRDQSSVDRIDAAIDELRKSTLQVIESLK
jgi:hypothetical protein